MAYKIKPGDTLSAIAKQQGTTIDEILKLNPTITDPNKIYAGADLILPGIAPEQPVKSVVGEQPTAMGGATTTDVIQPTGQKKSFYEGATGQWMKPFQQGTAYSGVWQEGYVPVPGTVPKLGVGGTPPTTQPPPTTPPPVAPPPVDIPPFQPPPPQVSGGTPLPPSLPSPPELPPEAPPEEPPPVEPRPTDEEEQRLKTEEELRQELYEKYGIEDLEDKFKKRPEQTFEDIYSASYKDLGLADLKADIERVRKEIAQVEEDRDKRIEDINENPWLSEASRVGRVKRETDSFEKKLTRLQNELVLADNMYSRGKEEAEGVATRALTTFAQEREWDLQELEYYINRAELDIQAEMTARGVEREEYKWRYLADQKEASKGQLKKLSTGEWAWIYEDGTIGRTGVYGESKGDELTAYQKASRADRVASQFDNEAVVKNYSVVAEGYAFAQSINTAESNSANDIGMLYAFAKAMDPGSVVREGEYATVQKYAQSWAETFGFQAARIFSNKPFLTTEAKNNMVDTIRLKYQASSANYQNLYGSYTQRIDNALGVPGAGQDYITDYSKAFNITPPGEVPSDVAETIEAGLAENLSLEQIRRGLADMFGQDKGYQYLDIYMSQR